MRDVWHEVLQSLHVRGFSAVWCTVGAKHAGAPMERLRWILYGTKGDLPTPGEVGEETPGPHWNKFCSMPPPKEWHALRTLRTHAFLEQVGGPGPSVYGPRNACLGAGCSQGTPTKRCATACACVATLSSLSRLAPLPTKRNVAQRCAATGHGSASIAQCRTMPQPRGHILDFAFAHIAVRQSWRSGSSA